MNRYRIRVQNLDKPELEVIVSLRTVGENTAKSEALLWCFCFLGWNRLKAWPHCSFCGRGLAHTCPEPLTEVAS